MLDIDRILVPIDFSEHAEAALAHAVELARTHDAQLMLLHVIEDPTFPSFYGAGAAMLYDDLPNLKSRAEDALTEWADGIDEPSPRTTTHVVQGGAGSAIVAFCTERRADLIVISSLGRTGLKRVMLGSVTEHVVRKAPCAVFVLKSATSSLVPGRPPLETASESAP
jgi:nucleotide-binding universal stress UspA family protein